MKLASYLALVKNLRGIIYGPPEDAEGIIRCIRWLRSRFRYRNIGLPPTLLSELGKSVEKEIKPPLLRIDYPKEAVKAITEDIFSKELNNHIAAESLALASAYVSPMILTGIEAVNSLSNLIIGTVNTDKMLSVSDYKLHMRIVDYSILDMYALMTESSERAIIKILKGENVDDIITERISFVNNDIKRYWRISSSTGKPFILYLDPLKIVSNKAQNLKEIVNKFSLDETVIALSIISAIVIYLD
jgi:hypothetical protein